MTAPATWTPSAEQALDRLNGRLFATVTEASAVLSYDRAGRTVRKAIEAGEIPATRVGGTWRIPVTWIRKQVELGGDGSADRTAPGPHFDHLAVDDARRMTRIPPADGAPSNGSHVPPDSPIPRPAA